MHIPHLVHRAKKTAHLKPPLRRPNVGIFLIIQNKMNTQRRLKAAVLFGWGRLPSRLLPWQASRPTVGVAREYLLGLRCSFSPVREKDRRVSTEGENKL